MNQTITVKKDLKHELKVQASEFRERMAAQSTLVINLVSSPGAGKTSLLQKTAELLHGELELAVLVGDLATNRDAERLSPYMPAEQLTTGGACHLEIPLVERGYGLLANPSPDILFIENVGNLVCPASHDLGEHLRVVLLSATEGDDKPGKYPKMYRTSDWLLITKADLFPHVPFDVDDAIQDAQAIQPELAIFVTSAETGEGMEAWCDSLRASCQQLRDGHFSASTLR